MTVPAMSARRYPAPVDDETLRELYEWFAPECSFAQFAETYRSDLEAEAGGE